MEPREQLEVTTPGLSDKSDPTVPQHHLGRPPIQAQLGHLLRGDDPAEVRIAGEVGGVNLEGVHAAFYLRGAGWIGCGSRPGGSTWQTVGGTETGRYALSVDGWGSAFSSLGEVGVDRPAGVTTRYGDVTAELAGTLDALPEGESTLEVDESAVDPLASDGVVLYVVWAAPSQAIGLVAISIGATDTFDAPSFGVDLDALPSDAEVELGLAISFRSGEAYGQVSTLTTNGGTVSSTAGAYDDGEFAAPGRNYAPHPEDASSSCFTPEK